MFIHAAVCPVPRAGQTSAGIPCSPVPLVINPTASLSGTGLAAILAEQYSCPEAYAGQLPVSRLGAGLQGLPPGALFTPAGTRPRDRVPGLLLVIQTGPDAGRLEELAPGRYRVGRPGRDSAGASPEGRPILVSDPAMSRVHAALDVTSRGVVITDCGSGNGTWVDGRRIRRARLTTSSRLRMGDSSFQVRAAGSGTLPRNSAADGVRQEPLMVEACPPRAPGAGALAGAFLPLGLGIVLAAATGMWFFLAFSGLAAITAAAGLLGFRRRRSKFRQTVASAADADRRRRLARHPDPGELALAILDLAAPFPAPARTGAIAPAEPDPRTVPGAGTVHLRLGLGALPAHLSFSAPSGKWQPPVLQHVPLAIEAHQGTTVSVSGPDGDVAGLFRSMLLQRGCRARASPAAILLAGEADSFVADARFLPGVQLLPAADEAAASSALAGLASAAPAPALLVFAPPGMAGPAHRILRSLPVQARMRVCLVVSEERGEWTDSDSGGRETVCVSLGPGAARLSGPDGIQAFVPDLVGASAFHRSAVRLASCAGPEPAAPAYLPEPDPAAILAAWKRSGPACAVIGSAAGKPVLLDLVADGPHVLVAGTTGSGKSELLRTLVASLSCQVPPSALNFLLIDFKGGSGLAPLAGLPHTAGFITDLSRENVGRALISLRAELRRRETLLAQAQAADLDSFNAGTPHERIPRLAVVVDEFRMLADSVPNAVEELMRIAALGRSLGLHLVLATQRPQGAVTADIRANVSVCLCLRVQSTVDSREVVGCDDAAAFPASSPGLAVLRLPGESPLTFQAISTSGGEQSAPPAVQTLAEFLAAPASLPRTPPGPGLDRIVAAVQAAAAAGGYPMQAPAPVQPPLPAELGGEPAPPAGCLAIGLADQPEEQARDWLNWDPRQHSHLALLGMSQAGPQAVASVLARQHAAFLPARHLYVLDGDGSLPWTANQEQTGAYVPPHETGRAARVLTVLSGLLLDRLTGAGSGDSGITVVVSGWGRWQEAFRSNRFPGAEDLMLGLARDGAAADICLLMTGVRELASARFFPLLPNRLWFPAGLPEDALQTWPHMPDLQPVPGRAFVQGPFTPGTGPGSRTTAQCFRHFEPGAPEPLPPGAARPRRIDALPPYVGYSALRGPAGPDSFPLGLGGDELETVEAFMPPGSVFLVLGPPRSGKTSLLATFAAAWTAGKTLRAGPGERTEPEDGQVPPAMGSLRDWLILADDADHLPAERQQLLGRLADRGARLVLSAAPSFSLVSRLPLAGRAGPARSGVLLAPAQVTDGEFFGVRLELDGLPRAGRGYLIKGGRPVEVQFALLVPEGEQKP